jgi:NADH-quinone oxidoreductase subunit L
MAELAHEWHGWVAFALHGFTSVPFLLLLAGFVVAWYCWLVNPSVPAALARSLAPVYRLLDNKYYFDWFNENVIARFARALGRGLWQGGDRGLIDGLIINGSARLVGAAASAARLLQSGYIYHYAFAMIIGIMVFLTFFVLMVH